MLNRSRAILAAALVLTAAALPAQKRVTYGETTFTVYEPLPNLAPTPVSGFAPEVPGYRLKSKDFGPGTYYTYAPGRVPPTEYACILTEIRDWVFYRPEEVKSLAAEKGLKQVDGKTMKKLFKNTRLPQDGLMYQLSENSWLFFGVVVLQNFGPRAWGSHEEYVGYVSYIEKIPQQVDLVLDRMYRFWNDGVRFADYAALTQSNFKTQPSAPTDQNPNNFTIGDVLNPRKGFYRLSFAGGAPTYVWHSYEKVVRENLKKPDFDVSGQIGYHDLLTAFQYELNGVKSGSSLYFSYDVQALLVSDLLPGRTWQREMAERREFAERTKVEMQNLHKTNAKALEQLYKEIFK